MITIFGLGFVGLTTALGFASKDKKVFGIDVDKERIELLSSNKIPFLEPHLEEMLKKYNGNNFCLTSDIKEAVEKSEFIFYCVGTPYGEDGEADLSYLFTALEESFEYLKKGPKKTIIVKSTIPPSTTKERIVPFIEQHGLKANRDVYVANNPEFLREGKCWEDFINADRIVIGCDSEEGSLRVERLYQDFNIPVYKVSANTGEFIKYLSNTMLATMISYANEMSIVADCIGNIEISKAFKILHQDKRWANNTMSSYVYPGCGYGGYCLPKDTNALYAISNQKGYTPNILGNVIKVNNDMVEYIVQKIIRSVKKEETIGILGLAFKPNSNDVRDAISAKVIRRLLDLGYNKIKAYDPAAIEEFRKYQLSIEYVYELQQILKEIDVAIILTEWNEFYNIRDKYQGKLLDFRYMN